MGKSQEIKPLRLKEYYRERIMELVKNMDDLDLLCKIYTFITEWLK